ncbi:hypothetical protein, partial [Gordonia sp. (in: high G+C Gram-positive bacteria)]|uniref:hypothetical protein n=1 Tax=Gordonia sp. (in: high G+C Gram-positive bacteria) TaxID=84139 RepID=UPI00345B39BC
VPTAAEPTPSAIMTTPEVVLAIQRLDRSGPASGPAASAAPTAVSPARTTTNELARVSGANPGRRAL